MTTKYSLERPKEQRKRENWGAWEQAGREGEKGKTGGKAGRQGGGAKREGRKERENNFSLSGQLATF